MQQSDSSLFTAIIILAIITLPIKGVALWRAAKNSQKWWFVSMLILNTVGMLELTYLFYFSKPKRQTKSED